MTLHQPRWSYLNNISFLGFWVWDCGWFSWFSPVAYEPTHSAAVGQHGLHWLVQERAPGSKNGCSFTPAELWGSSEASCDRSDGFLDWRNLICIIRKMRLYTEIKTSGNGPQRFPVWLLCGEVQPAPPIGFWLAGRGRILTFACDWRHLMEAWRISR